MPPNSNRQSTLVSRIMAHGPASPAVRTQLKYISDAKIARTANAVAAGMDGV